LLIEHGADRSIEDRNGNTAAATAQLAGHGEIAEYLQAPDQPG
jgi:ankyrin repeat protein